MKRFLPFLLFAMAAVAWGTLEPGRSTSLIRMVIVGVIAVLTVWKAVDFWQRFRNEGAEDHPDEARSAGSDHPA